MIRCGARAEALSASAHTCRRRASSRPRSSGRECVAGLRVRARSWALESHQQTRNTAHSSEEAHISRSARLLRSSFEILSQSATESSKTPSRRRFFSINSARATSLMAAMSFTDNGGVVGSWEDILPTVEVEVDARRELMKEYGVLWYATTESSLL